MVSNPNDEDLSLGGPVMGQKSISNLTGIPFYFDCAPGAGINMQTWHTLFACAPVGRAVLAQKVREFPDLFLRNVGLQMDALAQ